MFVSLLSIHILGAVATAIVGVYVCAALVMHRESLFKSLSLLLASLSVFEVGTGVALAVISQSVSVSSVCGNIALYLGAVVALQVPLYMRMKGTATSFPLTQTIVSTVVSTFVVLTGFVLGF